MKALKLAIVIIFALGLGACASQRVATSDLPPPDLKSKYIYAVEKAAASRNTAVIWVHAPTNEMVEERLRDSSGD